jgi:hypothetical protein
MYSANELVPRLVEDGEITPLQSQFNDHAEKTSTESSGDTPLSATGLFPRVPSVSDKNIEDRKDSISESRELLAGEVVAPATPSSLHASSNAASSAQEVEPAAMPPVSGDRRVDLTGVFRQVAVEKPPGISSVSAERNLQGGEMRNRPESNATKAPPARSDSRVPPADDAALGFTQMFQALSQPLATTGGASTTPGAVARRSTQAQPASNEEKVLYAEWDQGVHRGVSGMGRRDDMPTPVKPPAQGEFTSLFRTLEDEGSWPARAAAEMLQVRSASDSTPQVGGDFTRLLHSLSADQPDAIVLPETSAHPPSTAVSSSGPGEFTRIISGSMLREAQVRSTTPPANVVEGEGASSAGTAPSEKPPTPFPGALASPQTAPPATPEQLVRTQNIPSASSSPAPSPTLPALQPAAPSKLHQYMPLLLIANLFVMFVVLVVVVFVLAHR